MRGLFVCALLVILYLAAVVTADDFGCYKGYCYSWCGNREEGSWCYTTKTEKNDEKWVGCSAASECKEQWQCANTCHPKDYTGD